MNAQAVGIGGVAGGERVSEDIFIDLRGPVGAKKGGLFVGVWVEVGKGDDATAKDFDGGDLVGGDFVGLVGGIGEGDIVDGP